MLCGLFLSGAASVLAAARPAGVPASTRRPRWMLAASTMPADRDARVRARRSFYCDPQGFCRQDTASSTLRGTPLPCPVRRDGKDPGRVIAHPHDSGVAGLSSYIGHRQGIVEQRQMMVGLSRWRIPGERQAGDRPACAADCAYESVRCFSPVQDWPRRPGIASATYTLRRHIRCGSINGPKSDARRIAAMRGMFYRCHRRQRGRLEARSKPTCGPPRWA